MQENLQQAEALQEAVAVRMPDMETQRMHQLTHVPFASWCEACVRGRGRDRPHRSLPEVTEETAATAGTVIQIDYCFLGSSGDVRLWPVLIGWRDWAGDGFAAVSRQKGRGDPLPITSFVQWLNEHGVHGDVRLRSDPEPAIEAVAQAIAGQRGGSKTFIERSVPHSCLSIGGVNRYAETLGGLVRTLYLVVQTLWHRKVQCSSPHGGSELQAH